MLGGYIQKWAADHLHEWDITRERRAGGFDAGKNMESQMFTCTNRSSLFALLATAVFQFKTQGALEAHVAHAFSRLRLLVHLDMTKDEVLLINQAENVEQQERKRHTELDNIDIVSSWRTQLASDSTYNMKPDAALDVFKYASALGGRNGKPQWLLDDLAALGKPAIKANIVAILTKKEFNKRMMDQRKIVTAHPQVKTYNDLQQRHRFLRAFNPAALDVLYRIADRMGAEGIASGHFPVSKAEVGM